jgi:hypothetical protein
MGCCGDREKALNSVTEEQKWDYIVRLFLSCPVGQTTKN